MEQLTTCQLDKYENILQKIEEEHKKGEFLSNESDILDSKISAIALISKKYLMQDKLFKCLVKVFNSIFDVYELISDKVSRHEFNRAVECKNKKYYLLELYVAHSFQKRIIHQNWLINAYLSNAKQKVIKSINVKSKITNPIYMLIPFDASIEAARLKVTMAWPEGTNWPYLQIVDIPIDISYHFCSPSNSINYGIEGKVLRISQLYTFNIPKPCFISLQSILNCQESADVVLEIILKNSYHNLDPRKQASFSLVNDVLNTNIAIGTDSTFTIKLMKADNALSLHGECDDLYHLKTYFLNELRTEPKDLQQSVLRNLQHWKESLVNCEDFKSLRNIYSDLRLIPLC